MKIILQALNGLNGTRVGEQAPLDCIAVAIFEKRKLSAEAAALDTDVDGAMMAAMKCGDISGKPGSGLLLSNLPRSAAGRVLLIGMGSDKHLTEQVLRDGVEMALRLFTTLGAQQAELAFPFDPLHQSRAAWFHRHVAQAAHNAGYRSTMAAPLI